MGKENLLAMNLEEDEAPVSAFSLAFWVLLDAYRLIGGPFLGSTYPFWEII